MKAFRKKNSLVKRHNELILAKRESTYAVLDLAHIYSVSGENFWHKAKLLISNDSWYPSPARGIRRS